MMCDSNKFKVLNYLIEWMFLLTIIVFFNNLGNVLFYGFMEVENILTVILNPDLCLLSKHTIIDFEFHSTSVKYNPAV